MSWYQWFAYSRRRARDAINQLKHYKNGAEEWFYMYDADDERVWSDQPPINGLPSFDRWTLRGLDAKVRRTFELYGYNWGNAWGGSNLREDYVYRDGLLLASYSSDGYQRHIDVDHLGTPRVITRPASGQAGGFYTLTPCRILDTRQTGAPLTQINPQWVYQISGACGVPANAQAVALNVTLVTATANLSLQGYPGDLPAPGAPGTNVVSASPPGHSTIAAFAVLPLATNGSGTLGVLMTLAPPATSGQTDLILDVSGYFAPASTASVEAYHVYLPFGAEATNFAQDFERMKFTGHERDLADPSSPADDLDYMHARHYNFLTGRFLSVDRHTGKPGQPQSWNRYTYGFGSPLKYRDPDGREALVFAVGANAMHAGMYVTSGPERALLSFGPGIEQFPPTVSFSQLLQGYLAQGRSVTLFPLQTTEKQDRIMLEAIASWYTVERYDRFINNCTDAVYATLAAAGIMPGPVLTGPYDISDPMGLAFSLEYNNLSSGIVINEISEASVSISQSPSDWAVIDSLSSLVGPFQSVFGPSWALHELGSGGTTIYIEGVYATGVFY
jgi:RHS repeat-associated protein